MTLDPATVQVPVSGGVATVNWTLPPGSTQTYYRIEIHRRDDVPEGGGATHNPVGGTQTVYRTDKDARIRGDWIGSATARSMRVGRQYPSEDYLGNGNYTCRFWWRGQQTGILGNDIESRATNTNFTVNGSPYPIVIPERLRRVPLEVQGGRVRIDVFPAPRIVSPTELEPINLANDAHLSFDFEIPSRLVHRVRYFKLGFYAEEIVKSPRNKEGQPSVLSDDGRGLRTGIAEWVGIGLAANKIPGAPSGWQRYRTVIAPGNYYSAKATRQSESLLDKRKWSAHIRYADDRAGDYKSSEVDVVVFTVETSNAPRTVVTAIPFKTPTFLTKPVLEVVPPNPVYIDQGAPWFLNFRFINENGLAQRRIQVNYQGDSAKATALGSGAIASRYMLWTANDDGLAVFSAFTFDESVVGEQPLPVPAHDSDTLTTNPNTRVGLTDLKPGGLERRYFNFIGRASDGRLDGSATLWSGSTDGMGNNPQPLRVYLYRRLRVSRLSVPTPTAMPLNQREPTYSNGRAIHGFVTVEADIAHESLTHQQDTGNWPEEIKLAWYRQEDVTGTVVNEGARPFAYTSDYRIRPGAVQTLEEAASASGAEWVPTSNKLNQTAGTNYFEAVRDNGDFPLRFGEYIAQGGNVESHTFGGIPNGTWILRADMRDPQESRATETRQITVTISLPEVRSVLSAARIYDINHNVATTGPLNDEVSSGFAPGAYIGLGFTETVDNAKGLASYVEVERREVDSSDNVIPGTHVRLPGRLRPDSSGIFPTYRDYLIQVDKLYQYRCRSVRNPGTQAYSEWRPT